MKKAFIFILALGIFLAFGGSALLAAQEASPNKPSSEKITKTKKALEELGIQANVSTRPAGPLATIIPTPEYKRLPQFDFVPKRVREKTV